MVEERSTTACLTSFIDNPLAKFEKVKEQFYKNCNVLLFFVSL